MPTVNANIAMRLGTTEQWEAATVPLLQGEWGMEITEDNERIFKVGDGESLWGDLPAFTGQPGEPGREVSLQVTATHIQWRLGDDAEWQDLLALEDLKGEPGAAALPVIEVGDAGKALVVNDAGDGVEWGDGRGPVEVFAAELAVPVPVEDLGGSFDGDTLTISTLDQVPEGMRVLTIGQTDPARNGMWTSEGSGEFSWEVERWQPFRPENVGLLVTAATSVNGEPVRGVIWTPDGETFFVDPIGGSDKADTAVQSVGGPWKLWLGTESEYEAIDPKDPGTFYAWTEDP